MENLENKQISERLSDGQIRTFLKRIASTEEGQLQFIAKMTLTFGLRYSQVAKIFQIEESQVGPLLRKYSSKNIINGLDNLYSYGFKEPERVLNDFYDYINNLYQAYLHRNREEVVALLGQINDISFARFRNSHEADTEITVEEAISILNYQIKYFITPVNLCKLAKISNEQYKKCQSLVENSNPLLYADCQKLIAIQTKYDSVNEYYGKMKSVQTNIDRTHIYR